jgi:hypothetical protein
LAGSAVGRARTSLLPAKESFMPKIKLGTRPTSFKHTVKFQMLDGQEGAIEMIYKYRSRTEFGDFVDQWQRTRKEKAQQEDQERARAHEAAVKAAADAGQPAPELELPGSGEFQRKLAAAVAEFILEIADGWDLDEPFNLENVLQLADTIPQAAQKIQMDYHTALTEGRLGN